MNDNINDDNFLTIALENYIYKKSVVKSTFLADLRLILNFEKFFNKNYEKYPNLVKNQLNIILNLFGLVGIQLIKYKSAPNIHTFLDENV